MANIGTLTAYLGLDNKDLKKGQKEAESSFDKIAKSAKKMAGIVSAIWATSRIAKAAKETALASARYETLGIVMTVVGNNAEYTRKELDELEKTLRKNGIAMTESRSTIAKMAQAQIDLNKAAELGRIAQDAAVIGNINSSESFERMIRGIQSAQVEVLRNIGINVSFENSYKKLATQIGKNAKDLTELDKVHARTNAVVEAGIKIAGTYEASLESTGKKVSSLKRYFDDIKVLFGTVWDPIFGKGVDELTGKLKTLKKWLELNQTEMKEFGESVLVTADAVLTLTKIALVGSALWVGFSSLPILIGFITKAIKIAAFNLSVFLVLFAEAPTLAAKVQILNTALWGTSVSALAATGAMAKLKIASSALFALWAGWEIGKWLNKFESVRIAGVYLTDDLVSGWYMVEKTALIALARIKAGWDRAEFQEKKLEILIEYKRKMGQKEGIIESMLKDAIGPKASKTTGVAGENERLANALKRKNEEQRKANELSLQAQRIQQNLLAELLPLQTIQKDYVRDLAVLNDWYSKNTDKAGEYRTALQNLNEKYKGLREAQTGPKIRAIADQIKKEYDDKIRKEQELQAVMAARIAMEQRTVDIAESTGEITKIEAAKQRIDLYQQELEYVQKIYDSIKGNEPQAALARIETLNKLQEINAVLIRQKAIIEDVGAMAGAKKAWQDYSNSAMDAASQMETFWGNTFKKMEDSLMNFLESGTLNFEEFAKDVLRELMRIYVRAIMVQAITSATGALTFHSGMEPSYRPPPKFHNGLEPSYSPPKLHDGLKPDEFHAILQTGERVTSRRDVKEQNKTMNDYERWKNSKNGMNQDGGNTVNVPITLDPTHSKKFRAEIQSSVEETVLKVIEKFS